MQVVEYQPALLRLERRDLDYLLDLVTAGSATDDTRVFRAITPTHEPGVYQVIPGPFVGRLGLPSGSWIDFLSRFPFDDVIELLRRSARLPIRTDAMRVPAHDDNFLVEAIVLAFIREGESLAARGLIKGYRYFRQTEPPHGGRIDIPYHLGRLAARPDRLATTLRQLTIDTPENRALALALDVLTRLPLAPGLGGRLASLEPVFGRVTRRPMRAEDVARLPITNLNRHYRHALALAEVILRGRSLAPYTDRLLGTSILFFMPKVWETFVAKWATEQWPRHRVIAPYRFVLASDGQTAEADVTIWEDDDLVALYDAKYKWPESAPDRSDLYQLVTYCDRLGLCEATLVYPVQAQARAVVVGDTTVNVLGVRPAAAPVVATPARLRSETGRAELDRLKAWFKRQGHGRGSLARITRATGSEDLSPG